MWSGLRHFIYPWHFFNIAYLKMSISRGTPHPADCRSFFKVTLFIGSFLLPALMLPGQTENSEAGQEDPIFELSPFEVDASKDKGYLTSNATSGTRLSVPIKDLPMPVDVVNMSFIEDIAATDLRSALAYSSGIYFDSFETAGSVPSGDATTIRERSASSRSSGGNSAFIRGFRVSFQLREGFRIGGSLPAQGISLGGIIDTVNISRIEIAKGPQALLYGVGVLSGIVNVIPKKPLSEPSYVLETKVGSDSFFRSSIEATGPLVDNLEYRFGFSHEEGENWTDFYEKDQQVYLMQLQYRAFNNKVRIFGEVAYTELEENGIGFQTLSDSFQNAIGNQGYIPENKRFKDRWDDPVNWTTNDSFGDKGPAYRISGPDSQRTREEINYLLDVEFEPVKNLFFKVGAMRTDQQIQTIQPRALSLNNRIGTFLDVFDESVISQDNVLVVENPPWDLMVDVALEKNLSVGQLNQIVNIIDEDGILEVDDLVWDDFKTIANWWIRTPIDSRTDQLRAEGTYLFESDNFFGSPVKHTFLTGVTYAKDTISYSDSGQSVSVIDLTKDEVDGLEFLNDYYVSFRNPLNQDPFRRNDRPTVYASKREYETSVYQRGGYLTYQAQAFNDRLMLIAGIRYDAYNAKDSRFTIDYADFSSFTDPTGQNNEGFTGSGERLDVFTDGGGVVWDNRYQFDEDITETTETIAISWAVTEDVNVFFLTAGGLFPNTGFKDGNNDPIPPELTRSYEVGAKFELVDGKVSGSISFFRTDRENGIIQFAYAPSPFLWAGVNDGSIPPNQLAFDPSIVLDGAPYSYQVRKDFFPDEAIKVTGFDRVNRVPTYEEGVIGVTNTRVIVDPTAENIDPRILAGYQAAYNANRWQNSETGPFWDEVIANLTNPANIWQILGDNPISYSPATGSNVNFGQNPSSVWNNTNVVIEDETSGYEANIVFTLSSNFQFFFNYSHVEREVSAVRFVDPFDPVSGQRFFSPEEAWGWYLGKDAFDESGDPLTFNGKGIVGRSLYFAPEDSARFWVKYTFVEDVLEGLSVFGGVQYTGPAKTSVILGDRQFEENRFTTPDIEERYQFDVGASYSVQLGDKYTLKLALNIFNLFDDRGGETEAAYPDEVDGESITRYRRSIKYYAPRSWRISGSLLF